MPSGGDYPPNWRRFSRYYHIDPPVDPAAPTFSSRWEFHLARAYRKRCLDAARKRKDEDLRRDVE